MRTLAAIIAVGCFIFPVSVTHAALTFADWTTISTATDVASGSIGPITVSFGGFHLQGGVTDGSFTGFSQSYFDPPLAMTDDVAFEGSSSTNTYSIAFGSIVQNPRLHFASLASTLTFPGVSITRLAGQAGFDVTGSTVSGVFDDSQPSPNNDRNGTVQLNGSFSSISFTAAYSDPNGPDGIHVQIGVDPIPEPAGLFGAGLFGLWGLARRRRVASRPTPDNPALQRIGRAERSL
jgi:hypothetical protein